MLLACLEERPVATSLVAALFHDMKKLPSSGQRSIYHVFFVGVLMHDGNVEECQHAAGQGPNGRPCSFCHQPPSADILAQIDNVLARLNTSRDTRGSPAIFLAFCLIDVIV